MDPPIVPVPQLAPFAPQLLIYELGRVSLLLDRLPLETVPALHVLKPCCYGLQESQVLGGVDVYYATFFL